MTARAACRSTATRSRSSRARVAALVADLGLEPRGIAVAVDGEVVPAALGRATLVGASIEILSIAQEEAGDGPGHPNADPCGDPLVIADRVVPAA